MCALKIPKVTGTNLTRKQENMSMEVNKNTINCLAKQTSKQFISIHFNMCYQDMWILCITKAFISQFIIVAIGAVCSPSPMGVCDWGCGLSLLCTVHIRPVILAFCRFNASMFCL